MCKHTYRVLKHLSEQSLEDLVHNITQTELEDFKR